MSLISDYLVGYTYDSILQDALGRIPDTIDKREGSIIRDAISPACYELAIWYAKLAELLDNSFIKTAYGEWLDAKVVEGGLTRRQATYAIKRGTFLDSLGNPVDVPIGTRFSTIGMDTILNYSIVSAYTDSESGEVVAGDYNLQCETAGTIGNSYVGQLQPIEFVARLANATISTLITPGTDTESDDSLRERFLSQVGKNAFGGNVTQYKQWIMEYTGVGAVQIYPVWAGGGTVKVSILDVDYNKCSDEFCDQLKQYLDPENHDNPDTEQHGLGIAPIGHKVTVSTPNELAINISATITCLPGYNAAQLKPDIEQKINEYFLRMRQEWDVGDTWNKYTSIVYVGRISYNILEVTGVSSAYDITLNGDVKDITLLQTAEVQQIPVLGELNISDKSQG